MGNTILKDYNVVEQPSGCCGYHGMFLIYSATHKETNEEVSIVTLEKSNLPSSLREDFFYDIIKKETQTLTRLKHPNILRVLHPLDESRMAFVLVVEPILGSLANFINEDSRPKAYLDKLNKKDILDFNKLANSFPVGELEIKNGIRQLTETLSFLHNHARMYHCDIEPFNILITKTGDWKLGGFYFAINTIGKGDILDNNPTINLNGTGEEIICPTFDYCAPELINKKPFNYSVDMFGVGVLALRIHKNLGQSKNTFSTDLLTYQAMLSSLQSSNLPNCIPVSLKTSLTLLLSPNHESRLTTDTFLNSEYFSDILIRTLRYLDSILEKDMEGRIEFLKRLPQALNLFDRGTVERRILPPLLLQLKDVNLALFVLPTILEIAKQKETTIALFETLILPSIIKILPLENPPQLTFVFLQSLNLLVSRCSAANQRDYIIPLVLRALDSRQLPIAQQALKELSDVATVQKFEFREFKTLILPKLKAICCSPATSLAMRVSSLICVSKIFSLFDSETVFSIVIDAVDGAVLCEKAPAVLMCVLGVYDALSKNLSNADLLATKILPKLLPLSVEKSLNLAQFKQFTRCITSLFTRIEEMRTKDLEQQDYLSKQASNNSDAPAILKPHKNSDDNPLRDMSVDSSSFDFPSNTPRSSNDNKKVTATVSSPAPLEIDFFATLPFDKSNKNNSMDSFIDIPMSNPIKQANFDNNSVLLDKKPFVNTASAMPPSQSKSNAPNNSSSIDWFATTNSGNNVMPLNQMQPNAAANSTTKSNTDPFGSLIGMSTDAPLPSSGVNDFNSFNINASKPTNKIISNSVPPMQIQGNQYASNNSYSGNGFISTTQTANSFNTLDFSGLNIGQIGQQQPSLHNSTAQSKLNNSNLGMQLNNYGVNQQANFSQSSGFGNSGQQSSYNHAPVNSVSNVSTSNNQNRISKPSVTNDPFADFMQEKPKSSTQTNNSSDMFAGMGILSNNSKPAINSNSNQSKSKPSLAPDMFADLSVSSNTNQNHANTTSKSKPKVTKNNDFDDFY